MTAPVGAEIDRVELGSKTPLDFLKSMLVSEANVEWEPQADGTVVVRITVKDPSKVVNGKSYKVPLDVYLVGHAEGAKPVTLNVTITVKK